MLETLSAQERAAICLYNQRILSGDTEETELWADDFTAHMFYGHEDFVVDIGCGLGRVVPIMEDYGISKYIGIDPSHEHIKFCRNTFPDHLFMTTEVRQLGSMQLRELGGFIMLNVLMHIPKDDLHEVLGIIRKSLRTHAVGLLNTQHPSLMDQISDDARQLDFSLYETAEVIAALEASSFQVIRIRDQDESCMYHVVAI